jgi:hypothetical protein
MSRNGVEPIEESEPSDPSKQENEANTINGALPYRRKTSGNGARFKNLGCTLYFALLRKKIDLRHVSGDISELRMNMHPSKRRGLLNDEPNF